MMNFHLVYIVVVPFCYILVDEARSVYGATIVRDRYRRDAVTCSQRCDRIFERSLRRIGESRETLRTLLVKQRPYQLVKDACWKSFDYFDCMQHCELPNRHHLAKASTVLKNRCRPFIEGEESQLACISKFHSFLEVRCSTYLNEAIRLSKLGMKMKHDTCRHLHYHNLCLANNIFHFCPDASKIFTRLNLRDYFISFLLPEDDQHFSEDYLDDCQIYNFVKAAEATYDTTESNHMGSVTSFLEINEDDYVSRVTNPDALLPDVYSSSPISPTATTAQNALIPPITSFETPISTVTTEKILFSPERDLQFTPPNFFYSSLRSSTLRRTSHDDFYSHGMLREDNVGTETLPIRIDFTQQVDDYSHEGSEDEHRSEENIFTSPISRVSVTQPSSDEISTTASLRPFYKTSSQYNIKSDRNDEVTQKETSVNGKFADTMSFNSTTAPPNLSSIRSKFSSLPMQIPVTSSIQSTASPTHITESEEKAGDYTQSIQQSASHRTVADELSYPSVFAVTPHPATVSPKGDVYAELSYDLDSNESENSEDATEKRIHLQSSTYQMPQSENAVNSPLSLIHPDSEAQFTSAHTTLAHSAETVYMHEADAQLEHASSSLENLATTPTPTVTDAVAFVTPNEAIERMRQTKPAWNESGHALHISAEGTDSRGMDRGQMAAVTDRPVHIKHSSSEGRKSSTSKLHRLDFTKRPPIFRGRRIYVKPIRSWRKPINDDNTAAENDSDENSHLGQVLKKRTKTSAKETNEATLSEPQPLDLIRRGPDNRQLGGHSEITQSEYDGTLRLTESSFDGSGDVWDESAISEIQNETSSLRGDERIGEFPPTEHDAIMLFIYVALVSVALLTVIILLVALAVRKYSV
uniref:Chondroitin proteoglycan 4 domain-containing protein n=1 Tax=Parascaris univalens TaxID=6257 RepID=A0A915BW35_PARUN